MVIRINPVAGVPVNTTPSSGLALWQWGKGDHLTFNKTGDLVVDRGHLGPLAVLCSYDE